MTATVLPIRLRCEYEETPLGLDRSDPRFSWELQALAHNARQTAWHIQVSVLSDVAFATPVWDSERHESSEQNHITYAGDALQAHQRYQWRVRSWDANDAVSDWSESATFAVGILEAADWQRALWIRHHQNNMRALPHLRREFTVPGSIADARLYVTARGIVDVCINGQAASAEQLTPGWTDYDKRIPHRCWDVTTLLRSGDNAIGAILADGWFRGPLTWNRKTKVYGSDLEFACLLRITLTDGTVQWVTTDAEWRSSPGPILSSCLFDGEHHDAGLELGAWSEAGFDTSRWTAVLTRVIAPAPLLPRHAGPPVVRWREFTPSAQWSVDPGRWICDLGQNIAGRVRISIDVPAGTVIRLRFAEVLTPDRRLYVDNLRTALATDVYIAKGGGPETWEPRFTFHGFQYVEVTGLGAEPSPGTITGVVLFSDCPETGTFSCSNPMLNQLASNIVWTQRANYIEVPTDCPQRDERLGWTGDAQAYLRTATYFHDVSGFFTKWLQDLEDACAADGRAPSVAPNGSHQKGPWWDTVGGLLCGYADAAWGDAATICPLGIATVYADHEVLRRRYGMMTRYLAYYRRTTVKDRSVRYYHDHLQLEDGTSVPHPTLYGDWLAVNADTAREIIMTAFYGWSARMCRDAAQRLGEHADAERFAAEYAAIAADFTKEFVDADGRVVGRSKPIESQTGYVLALHFDLLPENLRAKAAAHLVADITARDGHLSTGFVGLPYLLPVLSRFGHSDIAFALLTKRSYPSWGYEIEHGATTIWERWNGYHHEKGPGDPNMNSYSHYAYGAVGEWLFSDVLGIEALSDGFSTLRIRPRIGGGLTHTSGSYHSIRGEIRSAWRIVDERFHLEVTIPGNVQAEVYLPTTDPAGVVCHETEVALSTREDTGFVCFGIGAGTWSFSCPLLIA